MKPQLFYWDFNNRELFLDVVIPIIEDPQYYFDSIPRSYETLG